LILENREPDASAAKESQKILIHQRGKDFCSHLRLRKKIFEPFIHNHKSVDKTELSLQPLYHQ